MAGEQASNPYPQASCKAEFGEPSCSSDVSCFAFSGDGGAQFSHTDRYLGGFTVYFLQAEETELKETSK